MKIVEQSRNINFEEFMKKPLFAHLATIRDSSVANSPVWFLWENNCLWTSTDIVNDSFGKRIQKHPECAISIVDFAPLIGKIHHVGFRGTAKVIDFDCSVTEKIFVKYLGDNQEIWPDWFTRFLEDKNARSLKFEPETVIIRDASYNFKNQN